MVFASTLPQVPQSVSSQETPKQSLSSRSQATRPSMAETTSLQVLSTSLARKKLFKSFNKLDLRTLPSPLATWVTLTLHL